MSAIPSVKAFETRAAKIDPGGDGQAGDAVAASIRTRQLTKAYGARLALRGVSITLHAGERLAVLGPNGAGKSTLLRVLALLARPTSGSLEILGLEASRNAQEIRRHLGVVLHESLLYPDLTVEENLRFFGRLYGVQSVDARLSALLSRLDLAHLAAVRVRHLSRGQRQRASLARALVHDPPVLLLDEPETGQDLASLQRVREELVSDGLRTVVFATHQAAHALSIGTCALLLAGGRARELGSTAALAAEDVQRALLAAAE